MQGMGGQLFQDALTRTAEHFGTNMDAMIEQYGSFRASLTEGGWLTTESVDRNSDTVVWSLLRSGSYRSRDIPKNKLKRLQNWLRQHWMQLPR